MEPNDSALLQSPAHIEGTSPPKNHSPRLLMANAGGIAPDGRVWRMTVTAIRCALLAGLIALRVFDPGPACSQDPDAAVQRLLGAASALDTAWPWQGPISEVYNVARYGKPVAPVLVEHLRYGPDADVSGWDLHVEQQVELTLCVIFGEDPVSGKNRVRREILRSRQQDGRWVLERSSPPVSGHRRVARTVTVTRSVTVEWTTRGSCPRAGWARPAQ
jgi:hypothetical protein